MHVSDLGLAKSTKINILSLQQFFVEHDCE